MTDDSAATATARFELVDYLPGGRLVFPVERDGEIVWLVLRSEMSEALCANINEYLDYLTRNRSWEQNWGGAAGEPPQLRNAS